MAFRDRKSSRDEREKARREERRKALSERLGGRPDQPGRSDAEREERARRRAAKAPAPPAATTDAKAAEPGEGPTADAKKTPEKADAKARRAPRKEPARRERKPKRRLWQRGAKSKPVPRPRRRPEPEKPKAEKPKAVEKPKAAEKPRAEKPKAGKPKDADKPRSRTRTRGDERRKPSRSKRSRPSREERVKALRTRGASAAKTGGKALRDGAVATRKRAKAAQPKVAAAGRKSWALLAPILAIPFLAFAFAERAIRAGFRIGARVLTAATAFLDRHVTPGRAVLLVALVTAVCLIVSQFQDFRGVEVGQPGYIPVEATVSADQVDIQTPRDAHGPWLLILAGIAIVATVAAALTRRRALGLVISAVGLAGLLVSVIGDRPKGLDAGDTAVAYAGTNAVLLDGFYAQVAACGVLIAAGLLVALYTGAPARKAAKSTKRERRRPRARPRRPVAEGGT